MIIERFYKEKTLILDCGGTHELNIGFLPKRQIAK